MNNVRICVVDNEIRQGFLFLFVQVYQSYWSSWSMVDVKKYLNTNCIVRKNAKNAEFELTCLLFDKRQTVNDVFEKKKRYAYSFSIRRHLWSSEHDATVRYNFRERNQSLKNIVCIVITEMRYYPTCDSQSSSFLNRDSFTQLRLKSFYWLKILSSNDIVRFIQYATSYEQPWRVIIMLFFVREKKYQIFPHPLVTPQMQEERDNERLDDRKKSVIIRA